MKLNVWFAETRPAFLLLSIVLIILGTSIALYDGFFNPVHFLLALIGLLLMHISVNVLNDYFDFKIGIDLETRRTGFSGGSGILPTGLLKPSSVYRFGQICLLLGLSIGVYFLVVTGWLLLPVIIVGGFAVYFYNTFFARRMLGEVIAGLGLGTLPVLGAYFVQSGGYSVLALVSSIPSLILTHNLLFLNEFPDIEPDRKGGRMNLAIALGRKKASKIYSVLVIFTYVWIIAWTISGLLPLPVLLSLVTIPIAYKAVKGALESHSSETIVSSLAANVMMILGIQAFMGLGFIIAHFLSFL